MENLSKKPLLDISNLHVSADNTPILHGLNLTLYAGEVHVLMGKNGQGKTTIAQLLGGDPHYEITQGRITYQEKDLLALPPHERAVEGIFLAFQQPIALPGVTVINFLKAAMEALAKARGEAPLPPHQLLALAKEKMSTLGLSHSFLSRPLNDGFSGGEKKRLELLQMILLSPTLAILDEPDSGLDAQARQYLGHTLQQMQKEGKTILIITHYSDLFTYLTPNYVHIINQGEIVKKGDIALAQSVAEKGYDALLNNL